MRFLHKPPDQRAAIDSLCESAQGKLLLYQVIDPVPQLLARLEVGNVLTLQRHRLTRLGIARNSRLSKVEAKTAKATHFDPFTGGQHLRHLLKNAANRQLDILEWKLRLLRSDTLDKLGSGHRDSALASLAIFIY
jgi:hypothetical protein